MGRGGDCAVGESRWWCPRGGCLCEWGQSVPLEEVLGGEDSCDCRCLCLTPGGQWPAGSGHEQGRGRCQEADSLRSHERAPPGDRVQPCGKHQLPASSPCAWPSSHGTLWPQSAYPDGCESWSDGVDGTGEATQLFTAAPHVDWKQICWGMSVVGEEGTHRSSFGFPVNLGCWRTENSISYYSVGSAASSHGHLQCCAMPAEPAQPELPLFDKPWETWKLKWPALRRQDLCITQHIGINVSPDIWMHIQECVGNFPSKIFPILSIVPPEFISSTATTTTKTNKQTNQTQNQA